MLSTEEIHDKFPFLKAQPKKSVWVYGNCDGYSWWNNLIYHEGWKPLAYDMFSEISNILEKHHLLRMFEIEQFKEKWSGLRLYWNFYPLQKCKKRLYKKKVKLLRRLDTVIDDIINKYENKSYKICIDCGKPAKYRTIGYILPYCEDCIQKQKDWNGNQKSYTEI